MKDKQPKPGMSTSDHPSTKKRAANRQIASSVSAHVHQVHQQKILGNSFLTLYAGWRWEINKKFSFIYLFGKGFAIDKKKKKAETQQPSNHTSLKSTASGARVVSSRWMNHKKKKKRETHGCPHGPSLCLIQAEGIITL